MKYMLMFISDDSNWDPSKPEIQEAYKRVGEWFDGQMKTVKLYGGEELKATNSATTVRQRDGKITVTDGPFSESKEAIGGYALVDVKDLFSAIPSGNASRIALLVTTTRAAVSVSMKARRSCG